MSEFFRITIPPEIASAGIVTLARLMREAEEADDDILLMQVSGVVESRGFIEQTIFREVYLAQWKKRMESRQPAESEGKAP